MLIVEVLKIKTIIEFSIYPVNLFARQGCIMLKMSLFIILLNFSNKYVCVLLRISSYCMIFDGCRSLPLLDMW